MLNRFDIAEPPTRRVALFESQEFQSMATATHPAGSEAAHKVGKGVEPLRAGKGYSFLLRKLHSLSGIVPIGAFLVEHILSNFEALKGPAAYAAQVKFLNSLPLVRVL